MPTQPAILLNATSGAGDKNPVRERLAAILPGARTFLAHDGGELADLAGRAAQEGCDPLIAGGGDGTINTVATVALAADRRLGVLPLGTFNHFAKDLGLPLDLEAAARVCVAGHETRVDVGEVNGHLFLNNSSLGLYPTLVRLRERRQERHGKALAVLAAGLAVLRRYPFLDVRLEVDGRELFRRTPFVFIGNNEYEMESFRLGARSCLDAGRLSLYVAHRTGRLGLLRLTFRALFGGLREQHDFDALSCSTEIRVETPQPRLSVANDGEVMLLEAPLRYRVRPRALRVLVPAPSAPAGW